LILEESGSDKKKKIRKQLTKKLFPSESEELKQKENITTLKQHFKKEAEFWRNQDSTEGEIRKWLTKKLFLS